VRGEESEGRGVERRVRGGERGRRAGGKERRNMVKELEEWNNKNAGVFISPIRICIKVQRLGTRIETFWFLGVLYKE